MSEKPHRKYELHLTLGADDAETLRDALRSLAFDLEGFETVSAWPYQSVSGAPDCGYSTDIECDPDMTPERYQEELEQYLDARKNPTVDQEP